MSRIANQARVSSRLVSILIFLGLLAGLLPVLPAQADPPVNYSYDFTGADDDPWEAGWTHYSSDPSEDMPTIEFDAGRHDGSGHGVISLRPETLSDSVQQVKAIFYDPDEDEQTWGLVMRSDGAGYLSDSGYYCALEYYDNDEDALLWLFRADDGDWEALDDPIEVSLSGDVWLKCEAQGPELRVKLWEVGTTEPSGWDFEVTDSTYTSGRSGILQYADRHVDVFVDDYSLEEYSAGPPAAEEVSIASPSDGATVFSVTTIAASVLPSEAEGTIEVAVNGNLIGSAPIEAGVAAVDWDTTTVSDGPVTVEVAALDSEGALAASSAITVSVENELDASERLATDYEAGQIDTSDYVELGLMSLYAFDLLPERYSVPPDDPDEEGNGLVIEYLSLWDQLDQGTQERLGQAVEATLILDFETAAGLWEFGGGQQGAQSSGQAQTLSTWPECFTYFNGVTACTHSSEHFEIFYVPESLAGAYFDGGVEDSDTISRDGTEIVACLPICNQVPDYVDRVAAALEQGWATYGDGGLGFRMPATPVRVSILNTRAHTIPNPFAQSTIVINNVNDHFSTPRHELFHMVQYEYAGILDLVGPGVLAWLEATAEWGAHQAARSDDNQGVTELDSPYYNRIGAVLSRPNWSALTHEDGYSLGNPFRRQRRQYGMFLLAEHLEESLAAPGSDTTIVERTWELIDAGNDATEAIAQVAADHGPTGWDEADQLVDFHVDAYVLTDQGALGFDDGDAPTWRDKLDTPPAGSGIISLANERPLAVEHDFDEAGTWDPTTQERPYVSSGGSVFALVDLEDETGSPLTGTLFVDAPAIENLAYTLVFFDGYPSLCADQPDPIRIDSGPGTAGSEMITLTGTCDEALLVISHTSLDLVGSLDVEPGTSGVGVQTDWTITLADVFPSPLNWDFETGDLTGWTLIEDNPAENWYEIVSPGLLGTNHAFRIETGADPSLGIEQTVMVDWRDCVVLAYATGEAGTTARLEVRDASTGTVWASHDYTFTGAEVEPVRLLADATSFLPDIYTVRLLYVGRTSTTAVVTFDQVEAATCE